MHALISQLRVHTHTGRVRAVGIGNATDHVWFTAPPARDAADAARRTSVVFFGGDSCSDIAQSGSADDQDILRLGAPSHVLAILRRKFSRDEAGGVNVFVVEPTRVDAGVWACYDNFLESTKSGEPARGYRQGRSARARGAGRG